MTLSPVVSPYQPINGLTGLGLNNGFLYIGLDGRDPETFPQDCFWDAAGAIPAAQPVQILGGYPMRLGTPTRLYTASTFSIRVRDASGAQVFYEAHAVPGPSVGGGVFTDIATATAATIPSTLQAVGVTILGYYTAGDGGGGEYRYAPVQAAGAGKFRSTDGAWWQLVELWPNIRQFGAVSDGVTSAVTAIANGLSFQDWVMIPEGTWAIDAHISIAPGKAIVGAGVGQTVLLATAAAAGLDWGPVVAPFADNRGPECGGFTIDANNLATAPFRVGLAVERLFRNIRVVNTPAAGEAARLNAAQNCVFIDCTWERGSCLTLDYGAGNNLFLGCEISDCDVIGLRFAQSGVSPAGAFAVPSSNRLIGCRIERAHTYGSYQALVYHGAGRFNWIEKCDIGGAANGTPISVVKLRVDTAGQTSILGIVDSYIGGQAGQTIALDVGGNPAAVNARTSELYMNGTTLVESHGVGWKIGDGSIVYLNEQRVGGVTTIFANQAAGTAVQLDLLREPYKTTRQTWLQSNLSAYLMRSSVPGETYARLQMSAPGAFEWSDGSTAGAMATLYGGDVLGAYGLTVGAGRLRIANGNFYIGTSQVVTQRQTGWAAPTGTKDRTTFDTDTVTLPELAHRVGALIDDMTTHGLIGP